MKKMNILKSLVDCGVVAVVRGKTKEVGVDIAKACVKGNVKGLEITFTNKYAADIIKELANIYECREDIVIGAGTVLDAETARIAILAGAKYIVSPSFNKETAILCNRYKVPYIPGVMTINEIVSSFSKKVLNQVSDSEFLIMELGVFLELKTPFPDKLYINAPLIDSL